jgi:hypothetical protein
MPVKLQGGTDSDSPAVDIQQETVQNNAVERQILAYRVTAAGSGYTSDPTVLVVGNGTGARARAVVGPSGTIVNAQRIDDSAGTLGQNYNYANVTITGGGGSGAKIVPVYGPKAGLGADARDDLRADAIMFNIKPDGAETGDFLIGNDFRQIVLLKNPLIADSDALFTGNTGRILKAINFATVTTAFTEDRIIQGSVSAAKGVVDYFDDSATLWYHQTEDTGFTPFTDSDNITETTGSGAGAVGSLLPAEVDAFSGEMLYIDNRAAVSRSVDQTEDIKVVIQL